jgi:hypothetical protein
MDPITMIAAGTLMILGAAFALFLGLASDRIERQRPH